MPHIVEQNNDSSWKTQLKERFTKSLDVMLQGALIAYENKLAELPPSAHEARYKLQLEYTQDQKNLKSYADEEMKFAILKEEKERRWCLQSVQQQQLQITEEDQGNGDDDAVALWKQDVVHEQVMILNAIKNKTRHTDASGLFQQGSSSKPLPSSYGASSSSSNLLYHHPSDVSNVRNISDIQKGQTQLVAAGLESHLRIEKHEKQQEEFRKRAEEIQLRKRRERGWDSYPESLSSSSSTSSSDQESSSTTTDNTSIYSPSPPTPDVVVSRLSEDEYESLVIFHDQQWDYINSLPHLQWTDFPWPVLSFSNPTKKEDLTLEAVADYVFAPLRLHHDRTMSKERLKEIIRRWHPDRFEVKYLTRVVNLHEREMVREGAGMVVRFLNDLLGKWNDV
jgi:hypothetical protein